MTLDNIVEYESSFFKEQGLGYLIALGVMVVAIILSIFMIYFLSKKFIQVTQEDSKSSNKTYILKQSYIGVMVLGFISVICFGIHSLITVPKNNVEANYLFIVQDSVDFSAEEGEVTVLSFKDEPNKPIGFKYLGDYFKLSGSTIKEITQEELEGKISTE